MNEDMTNLGKPEVFIGYAHEDLADAKRLYNDLIEAGVNAWMDKENLLPGQNWETEIEKNIRNCRFFLAILSSHSIPKRGYVQREWAKAQEILKEVPESDIFIIPARLEECTPPDKFRNIQWIDMFPAYAWENGVYKILASIGRH